MAMPLTSRNLSICMDCKDCLEGFGCRYLARGKTVTFKMAKERNSVDYWKGYYAANREIILEQNNSRNKRYPERTMAVNQFNDFIQNSGLSRPKKCSMCDKHGLIHAHHPNYDDFFAVVWLCNGCHKKVHNGSLMLDKNLIVYY